MFSEAQRHRLRSEHDIMRRHAQTRELFELRHRGGQVVLVPPRQQEAADGQRIIRRHDAARHTGIMCGQKLHRKCAQHARLHGYLSAHFRSSRFNILPEALRGKSSVKITAVGHL